MELIGPQGSADQDDLFIEGDSITSVTRDLPIAEEM